MNNRCHIHGEFRSILVAEQDLWVGGGSDAFDLMHRLVVSLSWEWSNGLQALSTPVAWRPTRVLQKASQPLGRRHLRQALGFATPVFERACRELERLLLLTRAQSDPQPQGWDSNSYTLVEHHFPDLTPLPRAQAQACLRQAFARAAPKASSAQIERWLKSLG